MERSLIVESRYARNYSPRFQAQFGVTEEEPDRPRLGPPTGPTSTPPPSSVPTPDNRLIRIAHRTKLIVIMTSLQRSAIWTPLLT